MIRRLRDIRLIPVVLLATICLFALKTAGIWFDGGYLLGRDPGDASDITGTVAQPVQRPSGPATKPAPEPKSWAQEMFNYPDVTGAVAAKSEKKEPAPPAKPAPAEPAEPAAKAGWKPVPLDNGRPLSPAERAILERLQERRVELDKRARDLDMREGLLQAAEKRVEDRIKELKELEARINNVMQVKDENEAARFKNVVTMYENMKAKDAARIFDRLDQRVLIEVATQINPRRMSDILAQMNPEAAERLTVELAARANGKDKPKATADLPKIEGKPTAN